jgi:hypothetical protein
MKKKRVSERCIGVSSYSYPNSETGNGTSVFIWFWYDAVGDYVPLRYGFIFT